MCRFNYRHMANTLSLYRQVIQFWFLLLFSKDTWLGRILKQCHIPLRRLTDGFGEVMCCIVDLVFRVSDDDHSRKTSSCCDWKSCLTCCIIGILLFTTKWGNSLLKLWCSLQTDWRAVRIHGESSEKCHFWEDSLMALASWWCVVMSLWF